MARDACRHEERPRGHPGVLDGPSRVQLAVDAPWTRSTGGVRAGGGETEREMEIGTYLQFLKSQGPLGKQKYSLFSWAQMKKC